MLSFEEIEDCFPNGAVSLPDGWIGVTAQWMHDFAHAIEAECAVPEVIGLYEKALKASWPNGATGDTFDYWNKARYLLAAAPMPAQAEKQEPNCGHESCDCRGYCEKQEPVKDEPVFEVGFGWLIAALEEAAREARERR